jgi:lon-related putative ATP-dependent protease
MRLGRKKADEAPSISLAHEPYVKFDLSADFYLRYRCKKCDFFADSEDDEPYTECECGNTDLWVTHGRRWALTHEKEFKAKFVSTADIRVPTRARDWLVGQEKPMQREMMEIARWVYKKKKQQETLKSAKSVRIADLERTIGRPPRDKGMVELDKKSYRVHFLDDKYCILEPGNFMKENPGPYILRMSEPGTGKTLSSKIINEEAPEMYREAGLELTDTLIMRNPVDEQRPLTRQVPCHSVQGKGCLAPRIVAQMERAAIVEQKNKQQMILTLLMIFIGFGGALLVTGLFMFGVMTMIYGIYDAWFNHLGSFIGFIIAGVSLVVFPMFIMVMGGGAMIFGNSRKDMLDAPSVLVEHGDKPQYLGDATVSDAATLFGSIQWNAYGNTPGLSGPLHKRVLPGIVHRQHDMLVNVDELKNMKDNAAIEFLTVMEDGETPIRTRGSGGGGNTESTGILMISTHDPVPADFMLIANGNMDMLNDPNAILNRIRAFFDRFNYGDMIYYETHLDNTWENHLKIAQVITDEISRFMLYPMESDGVWQIIEYMRSQSDNAHMLKIMFRYVIKVVLKSFEVSLLRKDDTIRPSDVTKAIREFTSTIPEQAQEERLKILKPFKIIRNTGSEYGQINGLAVVGGSAGSAFPIVAQIFKIPTPRGPSEHNFVVTGTVKNEDSWVADSKQHVRGAILKMYGVDVMEHYKTFVSFAEQKDVEGPSAGCAMTLALMSLLGDPRLPEKHEGECPEDGSHVKGHRKPVPLRQDVAVTGTIQLLPLLDEPLNVRVGHIGGVSYKVRGAADAGIKYVAIPMENWKHTLTEMKYPCVIFGADSILAYFDLLRADRMRERSNTPEV